MPKVILASRYLKKASSGKLANLVNYIGSRAGVELNKIKDDPQSPATLKQINLLNDLERYFPKSKQLLEYEDYENNPTVENASELINTIVEQNTDIVSEKENFIRYMGMRPNVEKVGTHGLFSQTDTPISLSAIANEVAFHQGNVWSHVLSLRREDAERLGYNNQSSFKSLLQNNLSVMAEAHNIPVEDIKWYAAFHNESHHPHVHLIVFSDDVSKGYLTNKGIEDMKRNFLSEIFKEDLHTLYDAQTDIRNELRNKAKESAEILIENIENGNCNNTQIERLIIKLHEQLENVTGKKVYADICLPAGLESKDNSHELFCCM